MKDKKMSTEFDFDGLLEKSQLLSEIEHEQAIAFQRQLRLLQKEHPELKVKRKKLRALIKDYEEKHWQDEAINDELIAENGAAVAIVDAKRIEMNQQIRNKVAQLRKVATGHKTGNPSGAVRQVQTPDGLSMAIHSKKDADTFMAEVKAISRKAK